MVDRFVADIKDIYNLEGSFILFTDTVKDQPTKYYIGVVLGTRVEGEMELKQADYEYIKRREGTNKCKRQ